MYRYEFRQFDNTQPREKTNNVVNGIEFIPPDTEINGRWKFVVIIVVRLAEHQQIDMEQVVGCVLKFKVFVSVFMSIPVNYCSVEGAHRKDDRQQQEYPGRMRKQDKEG